MTAASTTVDLLPWYQIAEPYLLAAFGVILTTLLGWLVQQFQVRTGIRVTDQAKASVQQAAMNAAGRILAAQEGNIAGLKIDVRSPAVAAEIPKLQESVGQEIKTLGMTPERVGDLIAGKCGILQAAASAPTPAVVVAPAIPDIVK
jgi:hypothetical protein